MSLPFPLRCGSMPVCGPSETAFTFVDYEQDWAGVAESLTWSQLYRRTLNVAQELRSCGSTGDRAVILAPQGLDYVAAFLGSLQAGMIAVPLSEPLGGAADERVSAVLRDASPSAILTTSSVAGNIAEHIRLKPGESAPSIIELDLLDLDSQKGSAAEVDSPPSIAHLQYTSGSTRTPAGVMVSHKNIQVNIDQFMPAYFEEYGGVAPPDTTVVSWLPLFHDMGLVLGIFMPVLAGLHTVLTSPVSFLQRPARWMQLLASNSHGFSAGPNVAFELAARKTSDDDLAGLDLGGVRGIINGAERVQPATLQRFAERFARFNLRPEGVTALVWARGGHAVRGDPRMGSSTSQRFFRIRGTDRRPGEAVRKRRRYIAGQLRRSAVADGAYRRPRNPYRASGRNGR